jgi:hypothetical protein
MATNTQTTKVIKIVVEGKQAKVSIDGVNKSFKELNAEIAKMNTGMENTGKATGGATATVLELGRAVSDFNYGIRGYANNLSQLVSNFVFMSKSVDQTTGKTVGFVGALKNVRSALMGPLGIILAFQAVIAVIEGIAMSKNKAKDSTDDLSDSLKQQTNVLKLYITTLRDSNTSLEEQTAIVKGLSVMDRDLARQLKEAGNDQKKLADITENFIEQKNLEVEIKQKEKELNESIIETNEKEAATRTITLAELSNEINKRKELWTEKDIEKAQTEILSRKTEDLNLAQGKQVEILNEVMALYSKLNPLEERNAKKIKLFKQQLLDLEKEILDFKKDELLFSVESEMEKLRITQEASRESLKLKHDTFVRDQEIRYNQRLQEINEMKISESQKNLLLRDLEEKHQSSLFKARMDFFRASIAQEDMFNAEINAVRRERLQEYENDLIEAQNEIDLITTHGYIIRADNIMSALDFERQLLDEKLAQDLERIDREEEEQLKQVDNLADMVFITEEFERRRTAVKMQNSNERIKIDEAERNARLQTMDIIGSAFNTFAQLSSKSSQRHKQLAIAGALIDTYAGVDRALNDKTVPSTVARFALAASTLAKGLLNVRKISSISPESASTASATGGGEGGRTFDFNLVGSTGTNQLAQAVGSQFQEPIQAYVVSSQITSQQELDLEISTGASLGG